MKYAHLPAAGIQSASLKGGLPNETDQGLGCQLVSRSSGTSTVCENWGRF